MCPFSSWSHWGSSKEEVEWSCGWLELQRSFLRDSRHLLASPSVGGHQAEVTGRSTSELLEPHLKPQRRACLRNHNSATTEHGTGNAQGPCRCSAWMLLLLCAEVADLVSGCSHHNPLGERSLFSDLMGTDLKPWWCV